MVREDKAHGESRRARDGPLTRGYRWVRSFADRGRLRAVLVQSLKAAFAAMLAWLVTAELLELRQPFLAPYTAVFLVEVTVYRSVWSAVHQVAAVLSGILLAVATGALIPDPTVAIGVAVLIGLLLGKWRVFGSSGIWVAVTALLLLSYGGVSDVGLLADRVLEVVIGAAIGILINIVIVPPVYFRGPGQTARVVVDEFGRVLRDVAAKLRTEGLPEFSTGWADRVRDMSVIISQAEKAGDWAKESMRFNPRGKRDSGATDQWEVLMVQLRAAWPHVGQLAEALYTTGYENQSFRYPGAGPRTALAELIEATATVIEIRADADDRAVELRETIDRGQATATRLRDMIEMTTTDSIQLGVGLGAMLMPAIKAFDEVAEPGFGAGDVGRDRTGRERLHDSRGDD